MGYILEPTYFWDGYSSQVYSNRCVLVEKEKIAFIGTKEECIEKDKGAVLVKGNWLVVPGFVDAHDHGRAVSPTGFGVKDKCLEMWLQDLYKLPPLNHEIACYYDGLQLLSAGVTTVLHSHNPNNWDALKEEVMQAARGYGKAGIRCILCPPYLDQNKGVYCRREEFIRMLSEKTGEKFRNEIRDQIFTVEEYLNLITELREELHKEIEEGMVEIQLHPNGGQWCSDEALLKMKEYAVNNNMKIHMHLLETKYQMLFANNKWGCSFLKHYERIGFLGPWLSCAHMVWLNDDDSRLLAKYGVMAVNNPSSNLRLRSGVFPLQKLSEEKVLMGIGIDGCGFDDDQDYLREMRTAFFNNGGIGVNGDIDSMQIMKMATSMGASIADGRLSPGIIKEGLDADFICISVQRLQEPYADEQCDIVDLLLHRGTRECVDTVFVKGKKTSGSICECKEIRREARRVLYDEIKSLREKVPWKETSQKQEIIQTIHNFYKEWEE